jgi:hypothetical protein
MVPENNDIVFDPLIAQAQRLVNRLERLSADSYWAHQASGVRGALLRRLELLHNQPLLTEQSPSSNTNIQLDILLMVGYTILEKAAKESQRRSSNMDSRENPCKL